MQHGLFDQELACKYTSPLYEPLPETGCEERIHIAISVQSSTEMVHRDHYSDLASTWREEERGRILW